MNNILRELYIVLLYRCKLITYDKYMRIPMCIFSDDDINKNKELLNYLNYLTLI